MTKKFKSLTSNSKMDVLRKVAKVIGRNNNVTITFKGHKAYTDGKNITVPSLPDDAPDDLIQAIIGYVDHEVGHINRSDFEILRLKKKEMQADKRLHPMWNCIEDVRMEHAQGVEYPGVALNFDYLNEWLFKRCSIGWKIEHPKKFNLLSMLMGVKAHGYMDVPGADELISQFAGDLDGLLHHFGPRIKKWIDLPDTEAAFFEAQDILKELDNMTNEEMDTDEQEEDNQDGESGDGDPDDNKENESGDKQDQETKEEDKKEAEKETGDGNDEESKKDDKSDEDEADDKGQGSDSEGDQDDPDEKSGDESTGSGDEEEPDEKNSGSGGDEADPENSEQDSDDKSDDEGSGSGGGEETDDDKPNDGDGTGADSDQDDEGEKSEQKGSGDEGEECDGDGDGADPSDEDGESQGDNSSGDTGQSDECDDESKGNGGEQEQETSEAEQDSEQDNKPASITDKELGELIASLGSSSDVDNEDLHSNIQGSIIKASQFEAINGGSHKAYSTEFDVTIRPQGNATIGDYNRELEKVAKHVNVVSSVLTRSLISLSRSRTQYDRSSGKINTSGISQVKFGGNPFKRKIKGKKINTYVEVVIDHSGSMHASTGSGQRRIDLAQQTAIVISEALNRVGVNFGICGFTDAPTPDMMPTRDRRIGLTRYYDNLRNGDTDGFERVAPIVEYCYKTADEPLSKIRPLLTLMRLQHVCCNADGDSIMRVAKRVARRKEARKILIVLSDGQPVTTTGAGVPRNEPKKYMREVSQIIDATPGMETIGIGIDSHAVTSYYKRSVVVSNIDELPNVAMTELKRALLGQ